MPDGIWSGGQAEENIRQGKLTRHRILVVNCGSDLTAPWQNQDASGMASLDPNAIAPGTVNANNPTDPRGYEGGPHFVMSGETPDQSHTYGFEFCLFTQNLSSPALARPQGYDVTIWVLIANSQNPISLVTPIWASFQTRVGVQVRELYSSFDVNATAIRFQFGNLDEDPTANNNSIGIAFSEL